MEGIAKCLKKVVFTLPQSFKNPVRTMIRAPFQGNVLFEKIISANRWLK